MDKETAEIVESVLVGDDQFNNMVMIAAKKALLLQVDIMNNGTVDQRLAAARGFMPIFAKVLAKEDQDINEQVFAETRRIMGNVIKRRKKVEGDAEHEGE